MSTQGLLRQFSAEETVRFKEVFCSEADRAFRFALMLSLNRAIAATAVRDVYMRVASTLEGARDGQDVIKPILSEVWRSFVRDGKKVDVNLGGSFIKAMRTMDPTERAILVLVDAFGLGVGDGGEVLGLDEPAAIQHLARARRRMLEMASGRAASEASDLFFFQHVDAQVDGALAPQLRARMDDLLKDSNYQGAADRFVKTRGHLQLNLQRFFLADDEVRELHEMVEPRAERETLEAQRIDEVGRTELFGGLRRGLMLLAAVVILGGGAFWYLRPPAPAKAFDAVQYFGYEALAMEDEQRLEFPSTSWEHIKEYLHAAEANLGFAPTPLGELTGGWLPLGASVIDYDGVKVVAVQYHHAGRGEKLVHFMYDGAITHLPRSERFGVGAKMFQAYASDQINLVAYESGPGVVSFLAGRRSAQELAELANR